LSSILKFIWRRTHESAVPHRAHDASETASGRVKRERPERVAESVDRMLRHLGAPTVSVAEQVAELWPSIVGSELAAQTRPGSLVDGLLTVEVTDGAAETHLKFSARQIARAYEEALGEGVITSLKMRRPRPS